MSPKIKPLTRGDIAEGGRLIADSLQVEPGFAAVIPNPRKRLNAMTPLLTGLLGLSVHHGSAYGAFLDERLLGIAIWLPPGAYPHSKLENLRLLPSLRGMMQIGFAGARNMAEMKAATERHFPDEPVWYLQALGISPVTQGQGIWKQTDLACS